MAHYAFLDENNIVTDVIVGVHENEYIENWDPESWYANFRGQKCKRTSINTYGNKYWNEETKTLQDEGAFRGNFGETGSFYDEEKCVFIPPKPFPSWILNQTSYLWEAPKPCPVTDYECGQYWDEDQQKWIEIPLAN